MEYADALILDSSVFTAVEALKKAKRLDLLDGKPFVVLSRMGWFVAPSPTTRLFSENGEMLFEFWEYEPGVLAGRRIDEKQ